MDFTEYEQLLSNIPNTDVAEKSFSIEELTNVVLNAPQSVVKTKTETIARIFGKTRGENFISDWLAFLMKHNPEVLRAVFQSADIPAEDLEFDVEREHVFSDGRRIDLLLTGENVIVGIENKIDSGKQNDQLKDYSKSLEGLASGEKSVVKIFLKPASNESEATDGFIEVTYERLLEELKLIPMDFILDLRGSFLLLDFIKHIEENIIMGNNEDFEFSEWTAFLSRYQEQISAIKRHAKMESVNVNQFIKDKMLAVVDYSDDWKLGNDKEEPAYIQLYKKSWQEFNGVSLPFIHFELLRKDESPLPASYLIRLDIESGKREIRQKVVDSLHIRKGTYELTSTMKIDYTSAETFNKTVDDIMEALKRYINEWVPKIESAIDEVTRI
ncbi:hypothetical protein OfM1_00390 [Lactovum odontotermitis]